MSVSVFVPVETVAEEPEMLAGRKIACRLRGNCARSCRAARQVELFPAENGGSSHVVAGEINQRSPGVDNLVYILIACHGDLPYAAMVTVFPPAALSVSVYGIAATVTWDRQL